MDDCIIVTFIDYNYYDIFKIFYDYFKTLNLNLLVVTLDENINKILNNLNYINIKILYRPYILKNKDDNFWKFRLNIINEIFKENKKNIIHTDSDCFWFKNIFDEINKIKQTYDIIGSIAYSHPINIANNLGFVLCCGFYFIKYTEKNSSIIDNIQKVQINSNDDQVLFNNYLYNNKISIVENACDNDIIYKTIFLNDESKVGIISNDVISRKYNKNLYCFHPYLKSKNIVSKISEIKSAIGNH
jgi:hypothetical protein